MFRHRISSTPVEIDAPVQRVWAILMDVDRYGEWNPPLGVGLLTWRTLPPSTFLSMGLEVSICA